MTSMIKPYFMENEDWYYHDEDEWKFKLTDKAPKEAIESYVKFYEELEASYFIYDDEDEE